jgi:hypothetical protein
MSNSLAFLLMVAIAVLLLAGGVMLVVSARRRGPGYAACGACGYNVSQSVSQERCPECGALFTRVGIIAPQKSRTALPRLVVGIGLIVLAIAFALAPVTASLRRRGTTRTIIVQPAPVAPIRPVRPVPTPPPAGARPGTALPGAIEPGGDPVIVIDSSGGVGTAKPTPATPPG